MPAGPQKSKFAGSWCTIISETETYCCGSDFASCEALGFPYIGPDVPCEVVVFTDDTGVTTCLGLDGASGHLEVCSCDGESRMGMLAGLGCLAPLGA